MDILFFAAIAFLIFYKLSKELGKISEEEKKHFENIAAKRIEEIATIQGKIIQKISEITEEQMQAEENILKDLDPATRASFTEILQKSGINAEFFMVGAKSAFEMIIKAFAAGDLVTLRNLLADNIYAGFEAAINARNAQEKTLVTNLISIEKALITSASLANNIASVVVKITSKQINYIADKSGQVVEGKKDEISQLTDVWTFRKDVTSPNPNWLVVNTAH